MNAKPTIRVAKLIDGDESALADFYQDAWGASNNSEAVAAARNQFTVGNPFSDDKGRLTVAVFSDEKIIGHLSTIPAQLWDGTRLLTGVWLKGFMVLEAYRDGPIGYMLIKEMAKHLDLSGALVVALPARRLMEAIGFSDVGVLPNYLSIDRPRRFIRSIDASQIEPDSSPSFRKLTLKALKTEPLSSLAGLMMTVALSVCNMANRWLTKGLQTATSLQPPAASEIDGLWTTLRNRIGFASSRDSAYISWRYAPPDGGDYEFITIRDAGQLCGLAIVRGPRREDDPRLGGLRVGLIADLLVDPRHKRAARAALLAARSWCRLRNYDAVLFTISNNVLRSMMPTLGYVPVPGNIHFMLRTGNSGIASPSGLDDSWLTRGDGWGDDI